MLDSVRHVDTPEGVGLALRPAGPIVRAMAWSLDLLVRIVIYLAMAALLEHLGAFGYGVFLIGIFLVEWLYPVFFEVLNRGATPGKIAMKLHVVRDDGAPVGWTESMLRNVLRAVDFLPAFYALGLVATVLHRDFKRLGDLAAGTLVVHDARPEAAAPVPAVPPAAPRRPLDIDTQRAVIAFAQRRERLADARALELAEMAEPITGARREAAVPALLAVAAWLDSPADDGRPA